MAGPVILKMNRLFPRAFAVILLHEKFLQFDWLRAVVFQLNLKHLHVRITNLLRVVIETNNSTILCVIFGVNTTREISKLSQISLA